MSALARYFLFKKVFVSGYDKVKTELTKSLEEEGAFITDIEKIETLDKKADLVIYTPAIPDEHIHLTYYQNNNFVVLKRSEILEIISKEYKTIAIAGTHGKTTITSIAAHIAHMAALNPSAFVGGLCKNFKGNLLLGEGDYLFVEADEYDRSFLKLHPYLSLISAIDGDHFDIYEDYDDLKSTFQLFANNTKPERNVILKKGLDIRSKTDLTYQLNDNEAFAYAENIEIKNAEYHFDLTIGQDSIQDIKLKMQGIHNVENAVAAAFVNYKLGVNLFTIKNAIETFKGIKRRFEFISKREDFVFIDDYAHHPKEIEVLLKSARQLFPDKKITIIFQPHLYSRTKDFYQDFAKSLAAADEVIVTEIYPARELPIEGVSSNLIVNAIPGDKAKVILKEELVAYFKEKRCAVLITAGAGDIDKYILELKNNFI